MDVFTLQDSAPQPQANRAAGPCICWHQGARDAVGPFATNLVLHNMYWPSNPRRSLTCVMAETCDLNFWLQGCFQHHDPQPADPRSAKSETTSGARSGVPEGLPNGLVTVSTHGGRQPDVSIPLLCIHASWETERQTLSGVPEQRESYRLTRGIFLQPRITKTQKEGR